MNHSAPKAKASIQISQDLLLQLEADAKAQKRSLGQYLETLLYDMGYRPYNEETLRILRTPIQDKGLETIDPTSLESFIATALDEDD